MAHANGWPALFSSAFQQSRNAMVLVNERRRIVDANAACLQLIGRRVDELRAPAGLGARRGRPALHRGRMARADRDPAVQRRGQLRHADGSGVLVQWGATTEIVTGRRLVLFVALNTSRWGARFRRAADGDGRSRPLSAREREIVRLVALGATGPEIADELRITHDTVRTHVRNAMEKQGARSRAHLVAKALGTDVLLE